MLGNWQTSAIGYRGAVEIERLREALREIAGYEGVPEKLDYTAAEMRDIARSALDVECKHG